jgi:hypothetical protein
MAKRLLTAKEAREFAIYCARYPIDDESHHHVPIANLHAQVANMLNNGRQKNLTDFLVYKPRETPDIEDQLRSGNW